MAGTGTAMPAGDASIPVTVSATDAGRVRSTGCALATPGRASSRSRRAEALSAAVVFMGVTG
jgi:hypothetical protein